MSVNINISSPSFRAYNLDGLKIEDNTFIGANVTFTNDLLPRLKMRSEKFVTTLVNNHASIGANATIIAGITIGSYAMVGAGSVITKDIPPHGLVYGNPAHLHGYVCYCGHKMIGNKLCSVCGIEIDL